MAQGNERTTKKAEDARREDMEKAQRETPEAFVAHDRSTTRDADDVLEDDRLTAKENEDESEG